MRDVIEIKSVLWHGIVRDDIGYVKLVRFSEDSGKEVEEALKSHPAVHDSNVVGVSDPKWGQAVTALVSLEPGRDVSDEELIAHTRLHLAAYKSPKTILRVPEIHRGPNGKADYRWALSTVEDLISGGRAAD